jgi:tetratricopeptide (TPR) repeat protein
MNITPILAIGLVASPSVHAQVDSANHYFQKAIEEKSQKHLLFASKHLDKAVQFNPNFVAAYLENGFLNLEMRRTDIAKAHFAKVCEIDPKNAAAIKELMELSYNYRQWDKAKEFAAKCATCNGADKIVAMSNYQQEDYGQAIKGLLAYLAKNPADDEATYTLARCYLELEDYRAAIPYYNKAVTLNQEKNIWAYELGMLYYTMNDYKNSVAYFVKAADKGYNKSNDYMENLGYAYIYSGEFEKGEDLLLKLMLKKPGDKTLLRDVADAYYNNKAYDKSLGYCQKLMEMDINDGKALYLAGLCFQKKGQKDKGQNMCDKAIEMDPSLNSLRQKNMTMN